jgi:hypothetical protein
MSSLCASDITVATRHGEFVRDMMALDGPWGLSKKDYPVPKIGLDQRFAFARHLNGKGVTGGLNYMLRNPAFPLCPIAGKSWDGMVISFNPQRVDFAELLSVGLPHYVWAWRAHSAEVFDDEFINLDFERTRGRSLLYDLPRLHPITFMDEETSQRQLKLSLEEVARRLKGVVEKFTWLPQGLLILGHTKPLPFSETLPLSEEMSKLVGVDTRK